MFKITNLEACYVNHERDFFFNKHGDWRFRQREISKENDKKEMMTTMAVFFIENSEVEVFSWIFFFLRGRGWSKSVAPNRRETSWILPWDFRFWSWGFRFLLWTSLCTVSSAARRFFSVPDLCFVDL